MLLQEALDHALDAARGAGKILMDHLGRLRAQDIQHKGVTDLVTAADRASERYVAATLRKRFPGHGIRGEEQTDQPAEGPYQWFVDPLDGTTNFVHGLPHFCVSIGLVKNGTPVVGVVHAPALRETFHAAQGAGAYLNGRPLHASRTDRLLSALLCTGFACVRDGNHANNLDNFERMIWHAQGIRRLGSAALDLSYVAAGRFDAFWELALSPWDVAAGAVLVREAGGTVSDLAGGSDFLMGKSILASNGMLHDLIVQQLANPRTDDDGPSDLDASADSLGWLARQIAGFVRERDWEQFHLPKNLAMSLAIEAAELMEIFQWLDPGEADRLLSSPADREHVSEEMADCLAYLLSLANRAGIDLGMALVDKIAKNRRKYPVEEWVGRARTRRDVTRGGLLERYAAARATPQRPGPASARPGKGGRRSATARAARRSGVRAATRSAGAGSPGASS